MLEAVISLRIINYKRAIYLASSQIITSQKAYGKQDSSESSVCVLLCSPSAPGCFVLLFEIILFACDQLCSALLTFQLKLAV